MSTSDASQRYRTSIAPDELRLTQELANTAGVPTAADGRDLLADPVVAQAWLDPLLADWGERYGITPPHIELSGRSLRSLRQLRDRARALLQGDPDATTVATVVDVAVTAGGSALTPRGDGVAWLTGAVAIELHLAELTGQRRRLKLCRNERCGVAFHDQSKNNSRTWHDVSTCGNLANVRAYRQRRRNLSRPSRSPSAR